MIWLSAILNVLKILPTLIKLVDNVWAYATRVSNGRPEQLLHELVQVSEELRNAKTPEDHTEAARRLSLMWANGRLPVKEPGET